MRIQASVQASETSVKFNAVPPRSILAAVAAAIGIYHSSYILLMSLIFYPQEGVCQSI